MFEILMFYESFPLLEYVVPMYVFHCANPLMLLVPPDLFLLKQYSEPALDCLEVHAIILSAIHVHSQMDGLHQLIQYLHLVPTLYVESHHLGPIHLSLTAQQLSSQILLV